MTVLEMARLSYTTCSTLPQLCGRYSIIKAVCLRAEKSVKWARSVQYMVCLFVGRQSSCGWTLCFPATVSQDKHSPVEGYRSAMSCLFEQSDMVHNQEHIKSLEIFDTASKTVIFCITVCSRVYLQTTSCVLQFQYGPSTSRYFSTSLFQHLSLTAYDGLQTSSINCERGRLYKAPTQVSVHCIHVKALLNVAEERL